jgi:predicted DsbA family dithiol-disulfide isomerase
MSERVSFSYWSDPLCIWAYVAQEMLDRILAELGEFLSVDYRVVPVFGSVPWRFERGAWSEDGVAGRVRKTREIAEAHGHRDVSGECWRSDPPASSWAVGAAIKAVCLAEKGGDLPAGAGARYHWALRRAFFVDCENIARRAVQLEMAERQRLPRSVVERGLDDGVALAALWEDYAEKERLRIQGSPTYVFDGGRAMLYGNFPFGVLHATVDELVRGGGPGGSLC